MEPKTKTYQENLRSLTAYFIIDLEGRKVNLEDKPCNICLDFFLKYASVELHKSPDN